MEKSQAGGGNNPQRKLKTQDARAEQAEERKKEVDDMVEKYACVCVGLCMPACCVCACVCVCA